MILNHFHRQKYGAYFLFSLFLLIGCGNSENKANDVTKTSNNAAKHVLIIHGGAGTILKKDMTEDKEQAYKEKLTEALQAGYQLLNEGKSSLDAVQAAINVMEDSPLFNAGRGAVFTNAGRNELDASIMDGKTLKAGAIAGVTTIKNPINVARMVMEKSEHVMLAGKGAEIFGKEMGAEVVDSTYFFTEERWNALEKARQGDRDKAAVSDPQLLKKWDSTQKILDGKFGTVGAVALDKDGNLAAGTSTGGMTNKKYGRVGDSPIIGAGTYCNNATAGISGTGWGEFYIRTVAAHRVSDLMELKGLTLNEAAEKTIHEIGDLGGDGGLIGLNKNGEYTMAFNTEGMYRGVVDENGKIEIFIYK